MELIFSERAWEDYQYWLQTDRKIVRRINLLIEAITHDPFDGIGKPEPLKHRFSGYWSRRIDEQHRIVYKIEGDRMRIAQLRYHY